MFGQQIAGLGDALGVVGAWMTGFKSLRQVDRFADASPADVQKAQPLKQA